MSEQCWNARTYVANARFVAELVAPLLSRPTPLPGELRGWLETGAPGLQRPR